MRKKRIVFFILSFLVILVVAAYALNLFRPFELPFISGKQDVSSKIENLYELVNPGINVTIEKVEEVSGMYKVLFKVVDPTGTVVAYREVYVTKDSNLLTENVILVSQSITQIKKVQGFVDCLDSKQVRIFGIANQTATTLQLNILGGQYATKIALSCDGEFAQRCVDAGITQVPSTVYQNKGYPGIQSIEFLQNLTGCAL